ncbi:hypothetical protein [Kingella potus]|uniref:hypothetical protein n=1 Tax=Kingella potus TaxID=265175 RepID=UPI001FD356D5|nr:hypothetical protein [Kingella potus]UOP01366.1 hypothetical protein LVJ84_03775 [Kingella potus]
MRRRAIHATQDTAGQNENRPSENADSVFRRPDAVSRHSAPSVPPVSVCPVRRL